MTLYTLEIFRTPSGIYTPGCGSAFGSVQMDNGYSIKVARPVLRMLPSNFGFHVYIQDGDQKLDVSGIGTICSQHQVEDWAGWRLEAEERRHFMGHYEKLLNANVLKNDVTMLVIRDISGLSETCEAATGEGDYPNSVGKIRDTFYHLASRLPDLIMLPSGQEIGY